MQRVLRLRRRDVVLSVVGVDTSEFGVAVSFARAPTSSTHAHTQRVRPALARAASGFLLLCARALRPGSARMGRWLSSDQGLLITIIVMILRGKRSNWQGTYFSCELAYELNAVSYSYYRAKTKMPSSQDQSANQGLESRNPSHPQDHCPPSK